MNFSSIDLDDSCIFSPSAGEIPYLRKLWIHTPQKLLRVDQAQRTGSIISMQDTGAAIMCFNHDGKSHQLCFLSTGSGPPLSLRPPSPIKDRDKRTQKPTKATQLREQDMSLKTIHTDRATDLSLHQKWLNCRLIPAYANPLPLVRSQTNWRYSLLHESNCQICSKGLFQLIEDLDWLAAYSLIFWRGHCSFMSM